MLFSKKLVILGFLASFSPTFAEEVKGRTPIFSHPFNAHSQNKALGLTSERVAGERVINMIEQAPEDIANVGLDPRFRLRQKTFNELDLYTDRKIESVSYGFDLDNIPVCDLEIKVHRSMDGLTTMLGDIPNSPVKAFTADQWATDAQIAKIVSETLQLGSLGTAYTVNSKEKCLWSQDSLKAAWKMTVTVPGGLNYDIVADADEVFRFDPKHFHAEGTATVYKTNINEGQPEAINLREMHDSGYLSNSYFQVCLPTTTSKVVCRPSDGQSAYAFVQEPSLLYDYDRMRDLNKFTQVSIFAHTNVALEWLQSQGYANFGSTQIELIAHAKINGDVNNALYQPASGNQPPMILVGDGDGEVLKNLGTDADVVSHELGHHVVYNSVTQISGESLVIHEALADFFTFARTGNACLGESICPDTAIGIKVCAKPKQCLRSAENNYALGDANLPEQAHLRGQFISGLLWDLHTKDGIPQDEVNSMVLKGIDLLVGNSGYKHLIVALLLVDHAEYNDKYCPTILARAKVRGLGQLLADVSCDGIQSTSGNGKVTTYLSSGTEAAPMKSSNKKSATKGCGVLSGGGSGQAQSLLLILSLPVAITWIRCKKP